MLIMDVDFILLLKQLLLDNENLEINGLIDNNGRIMQYLFNECRMFDLCNFTLSKLEDACNDYKISSEKCKSKFEHDSIRQHHYYSYVHLEIIYYILNIFYIF